MNTIGIAILGGLVLTARIESLTPAAFTALITVFKK